MKSIFSRYRALCVPATLAPLLLTVILAACSKKPSVERVEDAPEPVKVAESTPAPATPAATPAVAEVPPDPLAPEGVFFLLAKASVMTDDGIVGLPPGTKVTKVEAGSYKDDQGRTLSLKDEQVTNNLRLAKEAAGADGRAQAALRQAIAQREAMQRKAAAAAAATPVVAAASPKKTSAPPPASSFNAGALGAKTNDRDYMDPSGVRHWKDGKGVWHTWTP